MTTWTVYTADTREDGFAVMATSWTESGQRGTRLWELADTMEQAVDRASQLQREYDALRAGMAGDRA